MYKLWNNIIFTLTIAFLGLAVGSLIMSIINSNIDILWYTIVFSGLAIGVSHLIKYKK